METISKWQYLYDGLSNGKNEKFFKNHAITLSKIGKLKELNKLSDKDLKKLPKYCVKSRVNYIIKFLSSLTK